MSKEQRSWLGGLLVAAALVANAPPAWSGDIRVGFINPGRTGEAFWLLVSATMQAAASELGINLDIRYTNREHEETLAVADQILSQHPLPDYLVATNDIDDGGAIVKRAEGASVAVILLSNDLDPSQRAEFGEPRTTYRHWLGNIEPDHAGGRYRIAEGILTEAARVKKTRPLKLLALAGDVATPASNDRIRGPNRAIDVMRHLLGAGSVELSQRVNLDWTEKGAPAWVRESVQTGPRIDALWTANDPTAVGAITALREAGYKSGADVIVGGLNWRQGSVERVPKGEMLLTYGGLGGAWTIIILRDYHDGRDFAEEDVRLQFPMGVVDLPIARRFPDVGKIDWRQIDFTRFSKTRNPAVTRYNFTPDAVLGPLASAH